MPNTFTLTLRCIDRPGIIRAVSAFLFQHNCDITEHKQFDDNPNSAFFLRTSFVSTDDIDVQTLTESFAETATSFGMEYEFHNSDAPRVLVMVSRMGHCLNDLIFRWRSGALGGELVAAVSNHPDLRPMAEAAGLPFIHVPVTRDTKTEAEAELLRLVDEYRADLVVLARYMQVLSDDVCKALYGRAINIHHSFLPGFKGGKPYHQAYNRGVKLVGATAHYVTSDLDEGPIIEQEVIRIDHSYAPVRLATVGQDAEALALSRAVRWHCEHRVLFDGQRTVVFN
ncbi:formyltetrahydrofolate deformylase [Hoyosella altamirensis]|uniref:Formyltetrahydrofolate deformylase n=1 Tax=Hoyosella altamirensis TaxID=616997 RepID=A0A839RTF4_9ACTN|nr:formyltetrahydrofolate deformylase [Hoyosella altamirensis]MBB3039183.1 formyltetrahydrofolate deformylase [Hoyosella altamirensis]